MGSRIETGYPDTFPVKIFETDVNQVAAGTPGGGWVSGTPANLPASGSVDIVFDLGQDWHQYTIIGVMCRGTAAGGSNLLLSGSDTPAFNFNRRLNLAYSSSASPGTIVTASASTTYHTVRPAGRYLCLTFNNTDASNAQAATAKITIATYPC